MANGVRYFLKQYSGPTMYAASSEIDCIYEFHLGSGMNLRPNRHSNHRALLRVESFIVIGEKAGFDQ